jgi:hypothetical protein
MIGFFYRIIYTTVFLGITSLLFAADLNTNTSRSFWHPLYLGKRLDYCAIDGKVCGQDVASRFCQILGYDKALKNKIAYNVGLTRHIDSNKVCKGWRCNGFMVISCALKLSHTPPKAYAYREKKFPFPRYAHSRVDWCYTQKHECGHRAALSFCRRMGFVSAKSFAKESNINATRAIGSQELCFGPECNAFQYITCFR